MRSGNKFDKDNKGILLMPVLLLVAVLLSAAAYLFLPQPKQQTETTGGERVLTQEEIQQITAQGASDEMQSIEEDLGDTDLNSADSELANLESELNAAFQE